MNVFQRTSLDCPNTYFEEHVCTDEAFCENSYRLKATIYFRKILHHRYLNGTELYIYGTEYAFDFVKVN